MIILPPVDKNGRILNSNFAPMGNEENASIKKIFLIYLMVI